MALSASERRTATVLVVEDDNSSAQIVRRWLELDGYTVVLAASGAEALEAVRAHNPDIVLLDILIPLPSGELGAVEFLAKPLDVERVSECVRKYLGQSDACYAVHGAPTSRTVPSHS